MLWRETRLETPEVCITYTRRICLKKEEERRGGGENRAPQTDPVFFLSKEIWRVSLLDKKASLSKEGKKKKEMRTRAYE